MPRSLASFEVLGFDCYGTLIDWEQGIRTALEPLWSANPGRRPTDGEALQTFARLEHAQENDHPGMPYEEVLRTVHAALARAFDLQGSRALDRDFGASVPHWPPFPDTAAALRLLAEHYRLVILSNVSRAGIEASLERIGVPFDAVYTAEVIGSYKPDAANFRYMLEHVRADLGVEKDKVLHVAQSLFHDHVPARALGIANVWIDRQHLSEGGRHGATTEVADRPAVDHHYFTLAEFAEATLAAR